MPARNSGRSFAKRRNQQSLAGITLLSAAIVTGAMLVSGRRDTRVEAAQKPNIVVSSFDTVVLPVPAESVAAGVKISEIRFKQVTFPKQQVPEGAIENVTPYLESVTVAPLPANLPLYAKNLSRQGFVSNPVLENIPPGMRAMTVRVDATSAVEGWAGSGSYVDVLLVEKDRTTVVAEMVKILSAERSVSPVEGSSAPSVPSTVTLLVTQEQCLAINTAIPLGKIAFALRSAQDKDRWLSTRFTAEGLKSGGLVKNERGAITGYMTSREHNIPRSFALTDGKWIETEVVPEGFFAGAESARRGDKSSPKDTGALPEQRGESAEDSTQSREEMHATDRP